MSSHTTPTSRHKLRPTLAILLVPVVVAIVVTLFVWPSARLEPRDLPVGVAGAPGPAQQLSQKLRAEEGRFDVHRYGSEAEARTAVQDREVYGAFVATPQGVEVMTASAASPAVAQALSQAATASNPKAQAAMPHVEDVVPAGEHGAALSSSVFPLIIAGTMTAMLAALGGMSALRRIGRVTLGSLLAGVTTALLVQSWLDVVGGDWVANAAAFSLTALAISASVAGLRAVFGDRGLALGVLTMVFLGNPFSGMGSAPELLPEPVGGLGQLLPPGAGGNLVRSTGFFDGAAAGGHIAVLTAWAAGGLLLLAIATIRERRAAMAPAPAPAAATVS
jgi:hypothetical protein